MSFKAKGRLYGPLILELSGGINFSSSARDQLRLWRKVFFATVGS